MPQMRECEAINLVFRFYFSRLILPFLSIFLFFLSYFFHSFLRIADSSVFRFIGRIKVICSDYRRRRGTLASNVFLNRKSGIFYKSQKRLSSI